MSEYIIDPKGRKWVPQTGQPPPPPPPPPTNLPIPLENPPTRGLFVYPEDDKQVIRMLDDMHSPEYGYQSRTTFPGFGIALTNMTWPLWYFDGFKVFETKTICRLDKKRQWTHFFEWLNGQLNWEWICQPGIGWMDTNAKNTNPYDPTHELKLQSLDWGNNVRVEIPNPSIPARYVQVKTFDYHSPPVYDSEKDQWFLGDEPVGIYDTPELMVVQTLVGHKVVSGLSGLWEAIKRIFSLSSYESYGPVADKGEVGGRGLVITPLVMRYPGIHERQNCYFYRKPPYTGRLYADSLIVDGIPVDRSGGVEVVVDAYNFSGFDVNVRANGDWYLAETMLMRGDINDLSAGGTYHDYRRHFDYGGNPPPVTLPPNIGWRKIRRGVEWSPVLI